jgi:hypothetical protein
MKPKKFNKKLFLNKKTVANLNNWQMTGLRGGKATEDSVEVCCPSQTCQTDCDQNTCGQYTCERYCTWEPPKGNCTV